jgi:Lrp/AsnC family leucine-responsive transcriptional regulator
MPILQLDRIDCRILQTLQNDGRIANTAIAERAGLSPSPCLRSVRALETGGVIEGYRARDSHFG